MDVDAIDIGKEAYEQIGYQITKNSTDSLRHFAQKCQEKTKKQQANFFYDLSRG